MDCYGIPPDFAHCKCYAYVCMELEPGITYVSEDGNRIYVAVYENMVVTWTGTTWLHESPKESLTAMYDLAVGAILRTWNTTVGALDEITTKFLKPSTQRDLTKRPYKNYRNSGQVPGEDNSSADVWAQFRTYKIALNPTQYSDVADL